MNDIIRFLFNLFVVIPWQVSIPFIYLFYDKSLHHNSRSRISYPYFLYYKDLTFHTIIYSVELLRYRALREYRPLIFKILLTCITLLWYLLIKNNMVKKEKDLKVVKILLTEIQVKNLINNLKKSNLNG